MNFVFWQNVISIHQSAFIKALAQEHDVVLVAEDYLDCQRKAEKWNVPDMGAAQVIVKPTYYKIEELLSHPECEHVFSGINAYPMVYTTLKMAVKKKCKFTVLIEPYEWSGLKGFLRQLKYTILALKFGKNIKHMFVTGNRGMSCYRKAYFNPEILHQWGYFTEQDNELSNKGLNNRDRKVKLLYVGRLDENKNILPIIEQIDQYEENIESFSIVGDGILFDNLKNIATRNPKIKVLGRIGNNETVRIMSEHDYLILPSLYDGWGAVVNEALAQGTRVLCSIACGASVLLDGKMRGEAFLQENAIDTIKCWCERGPLTQAERKEIRDWATSHISGAVAADYFVKIITGVDVIAPWMIN